MAGDEEIPKNWPIKSSHSGESTANLAHDLKNLLTIMTGCVDSLEEHLPKSSSTAAYFADIRCVIDLASQIASELLGSGPDSSSAPVIGLNQAVGNLSAMLGRFLGPSIGFTLILTAEPDRVAIHPLELERILFNLVLNAREVMCEGGRLTIVTTTLEQLSSGLKHPDALARRFVRLTVADTGRGIAPLTQAKVFEAFYTTKVEGVGLGLSSVAETVHRLSGLLHLESQEGAGTRVHVDLPLALDS
jgi:two-component system cell cycle sensor histidine kinase/response regulator CckA